MSSIILELTEKLHSRKDLVEEWFATTFKNTPPFFYTSVDLRHSGEKLAPVDTNIFPAGFNNLTEKGRARATEAARHIFETYHSGTKRVMIIPENHTRNLYYLDNVAALVSIIRQAGREVVLGSSDDAITEMQALTSASGAELQLYPLINKNGALQTTDGYVPDLVITNNDFTTGIPPLLNDISQTVIPPMDMGWFRRRKTSHFGTYNELARQLCHVIDMDPWKISTIFQKCGVIDFKAQQGLECMARNVEKTLYLIRKKYEEYGIKREPYVFVKSDRGTYGMGIMTVHSPDEVFEMNKKERNKMNVIKGGEVSSEVIIQEGVPTIDQVDGHTAEHMMYLVGGTPVQCIYRINEERDAYGNLNSSGMRFLPREQDEYGICTALGTVAKLASFAAAWECYESSYHI